MPLGPGSIAFLGFNADGNDDFSIVVLQEIAAGTLITFRDDEWTGAAFADANEGTMTWTVTADIPAGTVVSFTNQSGARAVSTGTLSGEALAFSATSETLYAYIDGPTPTFLAAIANDSFSAANGVLTNTGLAIGTTAIQFAGSIDGMAFTGARTGLATFADYLPIINNAANWATNAGDGTVFLPFDATSFAIAGGAPALDSIAPVIASQDEGSGASTNFDFTVTLTAPAAGDTVVTLLLTGDAGDFVTIPATVTVLDGETSAIATFVVDGDTTFEPDENFTVTASLNGVDKQAVATIENDDPAPNVLDGIEILDQAESLQGFNDSYQAVDAAPIATNALKVDRIGSISSGNGVGGAESIAFDPVSKHAFVTNAAADKIDIIDLTDPTTPTSVSSILLGALPGYGEINSVAIKNGIVAIAIQNADGGDNGFVRLYDTSGNFIKQIEVGVQPDQLTFSADGTLLLVANEGERFVDRVFDGTNAAPVVENGAGSVTIISLPGGDATLADVRNTIGFTALDAFEAQLEALGIKINDGTASPVGNNLVAAPNSTPSQDIEPEYITISGTKAYVTLQEVNAVAVIDLADTAADRPVSLLPLGFVDHSKAGNEGDFSDRDGPGNTTAITINASPLKGVLNPDAIASFVVNNVTYFITANEGDSRIMNDPTRVGDPDGFNEGRASTVQGGLPADYARVNVDTSLSSSGDLYSFGGRGVSIFKENADGTIVKVRETGGEFEKVIKAQPNGNTIFNGQDDFAGGNAFDTRSDNKGAEPEGVRIISVDNHTYAIVALERVGGLMVYDVTSPENAHFVRYVPATSADQRPEVVEIVSAADSPTGKTLILTANEQSGTVTVYEAEAGPTSISGIQGAGLASTLVGQTVTVEAIVVGDFQNGDGDAKRNLGGFYLQEELADQDGNAKTSEGIFVFVGNTAGFPDVQVGDRVSVTGTVAEFNGSTQLSGVTNVTVVEAGAVADVETLAINVDLPAQNVIQRAGTVANSTTSFHADLEAYEGMLVHFTDTMTISEQFDLDRFVEVRLVAGDNPVTFTQENQPDVAGSIANLREIAGRTIVYEDGVTTQNTPIGNLDGFGPTYSTANALRMGDTVDGLTGVLDFSFNQYRVRSVEDGDNVFTHANPRNAEPADVGGTLKLGSFNVLNYFTTLGSGITASGLAARGASNAAEFGRQTEKLVNVISALDADVLGLIEIENNFLPGSSGNAIEFLVNSLNAQLGAGTYSWVNPGQQLVGGDAIAVGFIYKPSKVEVSLNTTVEILDDSDLPQSFLDLSTIDHVFNGLNTSRAPLAVSFTEVATGGEFTAVVNHFKSKSVSSVPAEQPTGADADQLDGQGAWQQQRELAAEALANWIATDPTGSGDSDVILLGDFNGYLKEDVLDDVLKPAGYTNLAESLPADDRYSFTFDGQRGSLDHILANGSAASQVTGVTEWHINSDEADAIDYNLDFGRDPAIFDADALARVSDHDPLLIGLDLVEEPFTLQLLHLSDGEAGLLASKTAPNLAALVDAFDDDYSNTIIMSGGDNYLPGPFLAGGTDPSIKAVLNAVSGSTISLAAGVNAPIAAVDIAILNEIGVSVSTIGNHEFDLGSRVFRDAFTPGSVAGWVGANFAYLSSNLDFSGDADLSSRFTNTVGNGATPTALADTLKGRIAPATVIEKGGQKIAFIGATTQLLESISSPNGTEVKGFPTGGGPNGEVDDMTLLAAQLQPIIDEMIAEGINKIIVQSHLQQIGNEQLLATKLKGVDVILAGGSNTRLGDDDDVPVAFPGHGADFAGDYPLQVNDADGKTTLIVNTNSEYTYLGRLVLEFNSAGNLILDSLVDNQTINGAYASTAENVAEAWGTTVDNLENTAFAEGTKGEEVRDLTDAVQGVINTKDANIFGHTTVYLEGERLIVRNQETNLGNITADANAFAAQQALGDVPFLASLKNGGGIRAQIGTISDPDPVDGSIDKLPPPANPDAVSAEFPGGKPEGGISQLDIENSLRFDNRLMVFDTTPEGLLRILNWGAGLPANSGGFPQIGGVKFSFDPTKPGNVGTTPSSRVVNIGLINEAGELIAKVVENGVIVAGAPALISIVALNFTANGGDGYPIKTMTDANGNFLATNFRYLLDNGTLSAPVPFDTPGTNRGLTDLTLPANVPGNTLGEQKAFADYLEAKHGTPDQAYDVADTPASQDLRIENLVARNGDDAVFDSAAPEIAGDLAATVDEGGTVAITAADLTEIDPDNSGQFLVYTVVGTERGQVLVNGVAAPSFTQKDLEDGLVTFDHDGSEAADASFTVTLKDPSGQTTDPVTVNVAVNPINDAPTAADDSFNGLLVGKKFVVAAPGVLGNDDDVDSASLTADLVSGPDNGIFHFNTDGSFDFTPFFAGPSTFTYKADDGPLESNLATVTINTGVGDNTFDLSATTTNATIALGTASSTIVSQLGRQTLTGAANKYDNIIGGSGNDAIIGRNVAGEIGAVLSGGGGNDTIRGGTGNDVLIGGAGDDRLTGGAGNDFFVFRPGFGDDVITDLKAGDTLDLRGLGFTSVEDVVAATTQGANAVIQVGADEITIFGVTLNQNNPFDILI